MFKLYQPGCLKFFGLKTARINRPAAKAADTDPSWCNSNNRQNTPWKTWKTQIVTNSKTLSVAKLKNSNYDKSWFLTKLKKNLLVRTNWHLNNQWYVLWVAYCDLAMFSSFLLSMDSCIAPNSTKHVGRVLSESQKENWE